MSSGNSCAGGAGSEPLLVHTRESSVPWVHLQMPVLEPRRPLDGLWRKRTIILCGLFPFSPDWTLFIFQILSLLAGNCVWLCGLSIIKGCIFGMSVNSLAQCMGFYPKLPFAVLQHSYMWFLGQEKQSPFEDSCLYTQVAGGDFWLLTWTFPAQNWGDQKEVRWVSTKQ